MIRLRPPHILIAVAVTLAVAAAAFGVWEHREANKYEARAIRAETFAALQVQRADSALASAERSIGRADSLEVTAGRLAAQVRERVAAVRAVVTPDTCAPFIDERDVLIDDALAAYDTVHAALHWSTESNRSLRVANVALRSATDSLRAVVADRPRPAPRWIPELRPFVGLCNTLEPCVGVGLTWRLF